MTTLNDFITPAAFQLPVWFEPSSWIEHGPFGAWIVEQARPRLLVELGSYRGYSFGMFCQTMKARGIEGRAIAIDSWQGDEHSGKFTENYYDALKAHCDAEYPGLAELKRMYFAEALPSVADGTVDLLHVDGRHFYDDVVEDFTSWIPKLSDRAVVLFHDTQVRERDFGVYKYWAELERQYPTFEFLHGNGLGVLGFGKNVPAPVARLFAKDMTTEVRDDIRGAYHRLGSGIYALRELRVAKEKQVKRRAFRRNPVGYAVKAIRSQFDGRR